MDQTVEQKLKALYRLQTIDSKIKKIHTVRGELPMEVRDLEDAIAGLETRQEKLKKDIEQKQKEIEQSRIAIQQAQGQIEKYESQQNDVKNNREYMALSKEIELQRLEIMGAEKKIKKLQQEISEEEQSIEQAKVDLEEKRKDLENKQEELNAISAETAKEEEHLQQLREKASEHLEDRLLKAYERIRKAYRNGMAVVTIQRESCGGCFSKIPPQRQLEVGHHKKIIVCENCGRILVDDETAEQVSEEFSPAQSS
jgi:predicted  nucleic acid-binding Zn-ribbon protein